MEKIYSPSFFYSALKVYATDIFKRSFSVVEVNGENNIPKGESVIFAPNHQNALIDAMAILATTPSKVIFLARADLFKKPTTAKALRALRIMPAYRIRDGIQNLKKNNDSFDQSVDTLLHKEYLCLMAEGGQDPHRRLRPLVKGMFRIAFSTQEQLPENDFVKIVPVGIDYGNYDHTGHHLIVNYGKPISIEDYWKDYQENAPVTQNRLRDELHSRMSELMMDVQSEKYYDTFYASSYLFNKEVLDEMGLDDNETNRLAVRKEIVSRLSKIEEENESDLAQLDALCQKWNASHKDVAFSAKVREDGCSFDCSLLLNIIYMAVFSPFLIYSLIFNGGPFALTKHLTKRSRGTGFEYSFVFGLATLGFPVIYLLYTLIAAFIYPYWPFLLAFFCSLPVSFYFFIRYRWRWNYVKERFANITKPDIVSSIQSELRRLFKKD